MPRRSLILAVLAASHAAAGPAPAAGLTPATEVRPMIWADGDQLREVRRSDLTASSDRSLGADGSRTYFKPGSAAAEAHATVTVFRGRGVVAAAAPQANAGAGANGWVPASFDSALANPCGPGAAGAPDGDEP